MRSYTSCTVQWVIKYNFHGNDPLQSFTATVETHFKQDAIQMLLNHHSASAKVEVLDIYQSSSITTIRE